MISTIIKVKNLLAPKEQRQAIVVLFLTLVTALLEVVGIASILPFIAVLSTPDIVETNKYLAWGFQHFKFETINSYLFFLGAAVFILFVISNCMKALASWQSLYFSTMTGHTVSSRLFYQYLAQPYMFFLHRNTSDLRKSVLSEVNTLVSGVIMPLTDMAARIVIIIAILTLLIFVDPFLALSVGTVLGGAFGLVYMAMRQWLRHIGQERAKAQSQRYKFVNDALLDIKNIKLTNREKNFARLYEVPSERYSWTSAASGIAGQMPRHAFELIAFGGMLLIVMYLLAEKQNFSETLPIISLYVFAGYRLIPAFQSVFLAYTKLRFHSPILDQIHEDMQKTRVAMKNSIVGVDECISKNFQESIVFKNVCFHYSPDTKKIINDLCFTLKKNESLGIIGPTGSGKTTIVDILLGLLPVTSGAVLIDNKPLDDSMRGHWQRNCAYVTQHIYLMDDTVRANIAFGIPKSEVNEDMVLWAAEMAAMNKFVDELPYGLDTIIGENGVRLSGGQRQRIALARALYLDRPVLILDEATSALDADTEREVMQAINRIKAQKTIVIITHRPDTLKYVDSILDLGAAS